MLQERASFHPARAIGGTEIRRHGIAGIRLDGDKPPSHTTHPDVTDIRTRPPPTLSAPLCFGSGLWSGCRRLTRGACVCQLAIIQLLDAHNYLQNIARHERDD